MSKIRRQPGRVPAMIRNAIRAAGVLLATLMIPAGILAAAPPASAFGGASNAMAAASPALATASPALASAASPGGALRTSAAAQHRVVIIIDGFRANCTSPGKEFKVNASGIHIRATPNGTVRYSIANGARFESNTNQSIFGHVYCISVNSFAGQRWVYGFAFGNVAHVGWVGRKYLTFWQNL